MEKLSSLVVRRGDGSTMGVVCDVIDLRYKNTHTMEPTLDYRQRHALMKSSFRYQVVRITYRIEQDSRVQRRIFFVFLEKSTMVHKRIQIAGRAAVFKTVPAAGNTTLMF